MLSIDFKKYTLSNGLDVILHQDHTLPIAAVNLWYHVGSKNEEAGRTGFAHLFEHIMFEGSQNHDTDFFEPLEKVGANINGSTTNDRTNYWTNVPANYLEMVLWLESDRMGFLLEALDQKRLDIQRDVVKNERRQSYENRPYGKSHLALESAVFPEPHLYSWPVIGSQEDLSAAELDDVKHFFRKYYSPNNASLTIAGDINIDETELLIERYFGSITPGPTLDRVDHMDSPLLGEVHLDMHDKVQLPRLSLVWPTGPMFGPDEPSLDLLASILGDGKSSRLHQKLVYEKQIARDVVVANHTREIAGEFIIQITGNPGQDLDEIQKIVDHELDEFKSRVPTERELGRSLNHFESANVRGLQRIGGFGGRADQLNLFNTFTGNPHGINSDIERYRSVSLGDITRAANGLGNNRVRMTVVPEKPVSAGPSGEVDRTLTPSARPTPSFSPSVPTRETLSNGLNLLHIKDSNLPLVSLRMVASSGTTSDPLESPGLSHFMATMLCEGTANLTGQQISEEMEFMGSHLISSASNEQSFIGAATLTQHWERALEILGDAALNASFPDDELERVRKERLVDLSRISDDSTIIAQLAARSLLYGANTPYGNPPFGTPTTISSFNRDHLDAQFSNIYQPNKSTLVAVGDISSTDLITKVSGIFGQWKTPESELSSTDAVIAEPAQPITKIYISDKPGAAQSVIRAGHLTIDRHHEDYYALNLLNYLFGGHFMARLNQNLRQDKGYSYGFHSSVDWTTGPSSLVAWGSVQTEVTKESVIEILKEFDDIHGSRPVGNEEFASARDGLLKGFAGQFETQDQLVSQICRALMFGLPDDYYTGLRTNYEALTVDDINRVARQHLKSDNLMLLVVGDREVIEPQLEKLGYPIVHVNHQGQEL
ncbi:insulinase family protein [SAR202 cluster bacterium AD-804-J14_MRT_500m]|nr:insulinase family protein [SAR202 cluster bacterium AD-804-J14_MRT_500m]